MHEVEKCRKVLYMHGIMHLSLVHAIILSGSKFLGIEKKSSSSTLKVHNHVWWLTIGIASMQVQDPLPRSGSRWQESRMLWKDYRTSFTFLTSLLSRWIRYYRSKGKNAMRPNIPFLRTSWYRVGRQRNMPPPCHHAKNKLRKIWSAFWFHVLFDLLSLNFRLCYFD